MDRHSHLVGNEAVEALELLPALPVASLTQNLTQTRDVSCQNVAQGVTSSIDHQEKEAGHNSMSSLYLSHPVVSCHNNSQEAPVRVELTLADLQSTLSTRKTRQIKGNLRTAQHWAQQLAQRLNRATMFCLV